MADQRLWQAIGLSRAGDREGARRVLESIIEQDPQNAMAWVWMTEVTDNQDEKRYCLEIALSITPDDEVLKRGLDYLGGGSGPPQFQEDVIPRG